MKYESQSDTIRSHKTGSDISVKTTNKIPSWPLRGWKGPVPFCPPGTTRGTSAGRWTGELLHIEAGQAAKAAQAHAWWSLLQAQVDAPLNQRPWIEKKKKWKSLTSIFTLVSTGASRHTSLCRPFRSLSVTHSLPWELATEVPFMCGVLLFIRTLGHLPAHIYVVISPITPPFVDPSGPSCPQRWNKCSLRTRRSAECGQL